MFQHLRTLPPLPPTHHPTPIAMSQLTGCCDPYIITIHDEAELQKLMYKVKPPSKFNLSRRHVPHPHTRFLGQLQPIYAIFPNLLCKTTMPLLSQGNYFACLILPSLQFRSACPLQTCYVLHDIHCTKDGLGVQFIHFADGWGNSILK